MSRQKLAAAAILMVGASLSTAQIASAQGANAAKLTPVVASAPSAPVTPTRSIATSYRGSWNGLAALDITVSATISPKGYSAKANLNPTGLTAITSHLKKSTTYAAQSRGAMTASGGVQPAQYVHQGGKKGRRVELDYFPHDIKTIVSPEFGNYGDPPATVEQRLESTDALSAVVSLVNSNSTDVCNRTLKIFDGKSRYNLALSPIGTEKVKTNAFKGMAQKCRADYKRIAGYAKPKKGDKPLFDKPFTIWFAPAANGLTAPIKISVESNWGPIILNLESWDAKTIS